MLMFLLISLRVSSNSTEGRILTFSDQIRIGPFCFHVQLKKVLIWKHIQLLFFIMSAISIYTHVYNTKQDKKRIELKKVFKIDNILSVISSTLVHFRVRITVQFSCGMEDFGSSTFCQTMLLSSLPKENCPAIQN
jgi:hypothetical protein